MHMWRLSWSNWSLAGIGWIQMHLLAEPKTQMHIDSFCGPRYVSQWPIVLKHMHLLC